MHFVHGCAIQQDASGALRDECCGHLDEGLDARKPGDFVIFTTDANCSIGTRADNEHDSVRGERGEPRRNAAGDFLCVWAGQRHLFAATTLFPGPKPQNGHGTWRHPRTKKACQNDHVFVQNGRRHRVLQCKHSSPLCATDHLAVKLSVRVQDHLEKSPAATDAEKMVQLDHSVIRPFQPDFDPSTSMKWLQAVETHVLENVDGTHHDRLQAAMIHACLSILPKKQRKHKHWYKPRAHVLNPFVR